MKSIVDGLKRRVARLEQRVEAMRTPEAVPVLIGELGEPEDVIRERHGIRPRERFVVVDVVDASRGDSSLTRKTTTWAFRHRSSEP